MSIIKRDFKEIWSFPENLATCYTIRRTYSYILSLRDDEREIKNWTIFFFFFLTFGALEEGDFFFSFFEIEHFKRSEYQLFSLRKESK